MEAQESDKWDKIIQLLNWNSERPEGHAPISVMGEYYYNKGGFMFL